MTEIASKAMSYSLPSSQAFDFDFTLSSLALLVWDSLLRWRWTATCVKVTVNTEVYINSISTWNWDHIYIGYGRSNCSGGDCELFSSRPQVVQVVLWNGSSHVYSSRCFMSASCAISQLIWAGGSLSGFGLSQLSWQQIWKLTTMLPSFPAQSLRFEISSSAHCLRTSVARLQWCSSMA